MIFTSIANRSVAPRYFVLVLAVAFALVFYGLPLLALEPTAENFRDAAWSLSIGLSNALMLLLCMANSRWLFVLGAPVLLVACALGAYVQTHWGVQIDANVIGAMLEADSYETKSFLTRDMWLLSLGCASLGSLLSVFYLRRCRSQKTWGQCFVHAYLMLALAVALTFGSHYVNGVEADFDDLLGWTPVIFAGFALLFFSRPHQIVGARPILVWAGLIALGFTAPAFVGEDETLWMAVCAAGFMGAWAVCQEPVVPGSNASSHASAARTLGLALLLLPALFNGRLSDTLLPVSLVSAAQSYVQDSRYLAAAREKRLDLSTIQGAALDSADKDLTVVLVVGESARADHFGLNGYSQPTTPLLSVLPGIVSFGNARSCAAATRVSVPCLLTRATERDPARSASETSLISMFGHFDFDTAWISTNQIYGTYDTPVTAVANEARLRVFPITIQNAQQGALDEDLLEPFKQFLARPSPRKLVVLHQRGSHWHYHDRYSPAFRTFTPTCEGNTSPSKCEVRKLINGYDNSILYTDHVLASVVGLLQERNALFLYTSDHGESLGEEGHFTHGAPERAEQRQVPMIWWASERFRKHHPDVLATLLAKRNLAVSHDNVFHSLLGCAGFHGSVIDESLNLCAH